MEYELNSTKISNFTDLIAWQEGRRLVLMVYSKTNQLPNKEKYNLIDQLERAAVSITDNIAEGFGRQTHREMTQFLFMAAGSLKEVQSMLVLCKDLKYIDSHDHEKLDKQCVVVSKVLYGLIKSNKLRSNNQ